MGKIAVHEFITLDGVIEDPGGSEGFDRGGWAFQFERGEEGDKFKLDELRLMVFPVLLGGGKRLFADGVERQPFRIVDTRQAGETVIVTFERAD